MRAKEKLEPPTATLARNKATNRPLGAMVRADGARAFRLKQGSCIVGSAASCDVVLNAPGVSRHHAELELVGEGVRVRDLQSRNGTFYLGQRVETITLALGATFHVGASPVRLDADVDGLGSALYAEESFRGMV